jgi:enhancing lycopene biosynthesis protein 2
MKKVAVILSGSGYLDGAEIRESVLTLLAIDQNNAEAVCFAPDINQHHVINHLKQEEMNEQRNVLIESARIARGKVQDLREANPSDYDAVILPGGFGVAKNLCDFAFKGAEASVNKLVRDFVMQMHELKKPIGAICISPALIALLFNGKNAKLTIGSDEETINELKKLNALHEKTTATQITKDETLKIVTTAAYMYDNGRLKDINEGISSLVKQVIEWT